MLRRVAHLVALALLLVAFQPAGAAITFVASSQDDTGVSTSVSPAVPTGTTTDDVVIAWFANGGDGGTTPSCTGFTTIGFVESALYNDVTVYMGYKVAGGSEGSTYTCSYAGSGSNQTHAFIATFRGVDTTTPIDVTYVEGSHFNREQNDSTPTPQPITTVTDGAFVVYGMMAGDTATTAITPSSGYTEAEELIFNNRHGELAYKEVATAGLETPSAITLVNGAGTEDPAMIIIALRPLVTATTNPILLRRRN